MKNLSLFSVLPGLLEFGRYLGTMTVIKMLSIHSFSRRRLGLQQIGPSSRWSPLSFRASNCLAVAALLTFTLIFFYLSYFSSFDLDVLQEQFPKHQIPILMAAGKKQWAAMLGRQSQNLDEAVIEYRIRYALEPPDGFDTWYYYAQSQNVTLIDEYDLLMRSLEPLRQLGPQELRRRTGLLNRAPVDINLLRVKANGQDCTLEVLHKIGSRKERTMGLMQMLEPVQHLLAEQDWEKFDVVVNELAESRVVGGEWHTDALDEGLAGSLAGYMLTKAIWEKHDFGERSLIDSVMTACGEESNFTRANPGFVVQPRVDGGVEEEDEPKLESLNWLDDTDICNHPELPQLHSAFRTAHYTTKGLYPILSYGAPSAYGDIPIPTIYQYGGNPDYTLKKEEDRPWEEKENGIYWRGSPTGGGRGDREFKSMHRHRLVAMTNPPKPPPLEGSEPVRVAIAGTDAQDHPLSASVIKDAYNEQFTNITFVGIEKNDCNFFECRELDSHFRFEGKKPLSEVWRWKMAIDIDGWGYSARWRALIASKSMALKTTIYREWYTERMIPWVHFVPISPKMNELYDVLGYFFGGGEEAPLIVPHDEQAKQIAEAGKEWAQKHMRNEDMTVYVYRLMLEMNRLYNGEEQIYRHSSTY